MAKTKVVRIWVPVLIVQFEVLLHNWFIENLE